MKLFLLLLGLAFSVIRVAYKGRCLRPDIPECNFSSVVKNVCGNDGLTYLNPAMVACKNKLQPKKSINFSNLIKMLHRCFLYARFRGENRWQGQM
jgi:hypothetical protein